MTTTIDDELPISQMREAPPRWVRIAAHAAALTPVPTGLWRLLLAFGVPAGFTAQGYADLVASGTTPAYLIALSLVAEGAALLTLGLIQPWGEVVPSWIPFIGGRVVPVNAAVLPAAIGAALLTALWAQLLWWWSVPHPDMTPIGHAVVGILYFPLVVWGPLLAIVTVSYARRRRRAINPAIASPSSPRRMSR